MRIVHLLTVVAVAGTLSACGGTPVLSAPTPTETPTPRTVAKGDWAYVPKAVPGRTCAAALVGQLASMSKVKYVAYEQSHIQCVREDDDWYWQAVA